MPRLSGPYRTEAEAAAEAMPHEVDALRTARGDDYVASARRLRDARSIALQALLAACTEAGVEVGDYDRRVLDWLAGWEPTAAQVVIGLIGRAHAAVWATCEAEDGS